MIAPAQGLVLRRILVGVDEDGHGDVALLAAIRLAERTGCAVEPLHAVPLTRSPWARRDPLRAAAEGSERLRQGLERVLARLRGTVRGTSWEDAPLESRVRVVPGKPAAVLAQEAAASGADLIVIGPHARRGLVDFGSTARGLLATAPCPVWIQPEAPRELRHVVASVDLGDQSAPVLATAASVARAFGARVTALHALAPARGGLLAALAGGAGGGSGAAEAGAEAARELGELLRSAEWRGTPHAAVVVEGEPVGALLEREPHVDLVVLGAHGEGMFSPAVLGGTAYRLLRAARTPVLVLRARGAAAALAARS